MSPETLIQLINERHRTSYRLGQRFDRGEQGAYAIFDEQDRPYVLKWAPGTALLSSLHRARVLTERLVDFGYPLPRYRHLGVIEGNSFAIQERLPGAPMGQLDEAHLPRLLELNDFQAGQAAQLESDWPAFITSSVLVGFDQYCVVSSMERYSAATCELLSILQHLVAGQVDADYSTNDIVHFDFNPMNILVDGDEISGIVDWDSPFAGDRAFDIATLLFYAHRRPDLRERLWQAAVERTAPAIVAVYLAHLIVRQVDWSIRHHDQAVIDHWIRASQRIMQDHIVGVT